MSLQSINEDTKDDHGKDDWIENDEKKTEGNVVTGHTVDSDDEEVSEFLRNNFTTNTISTEKMSMSSEKTRPPQVSEGHDNSVAGAFAVEGRAVGSMPVWAAAASRTAASTPVPGGTNHSQNQNSTSQSTNRWSNRRRNTARRSTYRWSLFGRQNQDLQEEEDSWAVGSMPVWTAQRATPVPEGTNHSRNTTRRSTLRSSNYNENTTRRNTQRWSLFRSPERVPEQEEQNPHPEPDLATAHSVSDAVPIVYPNAITTSDELDEEARKGRKSQRTFWIGVAVLVALVGSGVGIAVGKGLVKQNNSSATTNTASPSESPTTSPTVTPDFIGQCQIHNEIVDKTVVSRNTSCFYDHLKKMTNLTFEDTDDFKYSCNSSSLALWWLSQDQLTIGRNGLLRRNDDVARLVIDSCGTNFTDEIRNSVFKKGSKKKKKSAVSRPNDGESGGEGSICKAGGGTKSFDQAMDHARQRYGLIVMYLSLGGDNWLKRNNWMDDKKQECSWEGLTCTAKDFVTTMELQSNNLIGPFPEEIKYLIHVKRLYLHENHITGTLPETIWSDDLKDIRYVNFNNNKLSGTIPDAFNFTSIVERGIDKISSDNSSKYDAFREAVNGSDFDEIPPEAFFGLTLKIPVEDMGDNGALEMDHLDLSDNDFTGTLPRGWFLGENLRKYVKWQSYKYSVL